VRGAVLAKGRVRDADIRPSGSEGFEISDIENA
jgi:hypothetical protein